MSGSQKSRDIYFDNVKFVLIMLVVVGHFIEQCTENSHTARSMFLFIYSFHMPLFIFITGYFCKRLIRRKEDVIKRAYVFGMLFILFKFIIFIIKIVFGQAGEFHFFAESGVPWYLWSVSIYYLAAWRLQDINKKTLLFCSLLIGCICGYDTSIGDFMVLSRTFVFFPFFVMGWMVSKDGIAKLKNHTWLKPAAVFVFAAAALLSVIYIDRLYFLRPLFTGRNSFKVLHDNFYKGGGTASADVSDQYGSRYFGADPRAREKSGDAQQSGTENSSDIFSAQTCIIYSGLLPCG